jgi:DNA replication protein DnaC
MRTRAPLKATPARTKLRPKTLPMRTELCQKVLEDFQVLGIPLRVEQLDAVLSRAQSEGMSHLEFLRVLLSEQANGRRERRIAHRIREAGFAESKTLIDFDWQFNAATIDRVRIEALAGGEFIGRRQNLLWVGQSGVGKSHLIQAIGQRACVLGYRVRYETSASILRELTAALADRTLARELRYYGKFDMLILDEFGFDRLERIESPEAVSLLYKLINARSGRSTALVTNIDFEAWDKYMSDAQLAMAFLDRIVDGADVMKLKGRSYRAYRAELASTGR